VLFDASIAENIGYARPGASAEQIVAAAQAADAHEFVVRLPRGYETRVGERGLELSVGQPQRIALARAFLKDRPVLILIDPTSGLDPHTQAVIGPALERLQRGRTVIFITHRDDALARCATVLTMEQGRVAREATPVVADSSPVRPAAGRTLPPAVSERRRERLRAHPAVQAWGRLTPERPVPRQIVALKPAPGRIGKTAVYRLDGVGDGDSAVIAKRGKHGATLIERIVYEEILASLELPSLRYYGCIESPDGASPWLFIEEATGEEYSPLLEAHRFHAGRWLGLLHASATGGATKGRLPDAGPERYRGHLREARERIRQDVDSPVLAEDDAGFLEELVARLDELEAGWARLEAACVGVPETLVHGDLKGHNLRVRASDRGVALVVFDWEDAGWGVPAVDLAQRLVPGNRHGVNPDLAGYWAVVRERWPDVTAEAVRRLGHCGTVFRALAALDWGSSHLADERPDAFVRNARLYEAEIAQALERLGWAGVLEREAGRVSGGPRRVS
jgi:energy-coupling factor transporter ATP-binding protein EcfA2